LQTSSPSIGSRSRVRESVALPLSAKLGAVFTRAFREGLFGVGPIDHATLAAAIAVRLAVAPRHGFRRAAPPRASRFPSPCNSPTHARRWERGDPRAQFAGGRLPSLAALVQARPVPTPCRRATAPWCSSALQARLAIHRPHDQAEVVARVPAWSEALTEASLARAISLLYLKKCRSGAALESSN
jgi:hypothetical protein